MISQLIKINTWMDVLWEMYSVLSIFYLRLNVLTKLQSCNYFDLNKVT